MSRPRILFAHERPEVARAVQRVLEREGFTFQHVNDGDACKWTLLRERWDGLVVDVALSGTAGYELVDLARSAGPDAGAQVVVLVASVYRRTSYKRRPTRLYGADDYVEVHHLCDNLPRKLYEHLGLPPVAPAEQVEAEAREALRVEGDARFDLLSADHRKLATLIVADMVLYNGDAIHAATNLPTALQAVGLDLDIARELYTQVVRAEGGGRNPGDPIGDAFATLMNSLGRGEAT